MAWSSPSCVIVSAQTRQRRRNLVPAVLGARQRFRPRGTAHQGREGRRRVINGQKIWTSGAHYSDYGMIVTRTDPTVAKHKGLTAFLVDMKAAGVDQTDQAVDR